MDSDRPARDRDRDAAIRLVEGAWADGQIVEADRDKRIDELRHARTMREVEMMVHDLRPVGYAQPPVASPPPEAPAPEPEPAPAPAPRPSPYDTDPEPYRAPDPAPDPGRTHHVRHVGGFPVHVTTWHLGSGRRPVTRQVRAPRGIRLVPLLFMGFVAFTILSSVVNTCGTAVDVVQDRGASGSPTLPPGQAPGEGELNLISVEGYDALVSDLEAELGSSEAFNAVLYPTYAVVEAPMDDTSQREQHYYWDGSLSLSGSRGTSSEPRFDLRDIDMDVVVDLVEQVRARVQDPTSWYVMLHAPEEGDGSVVQAYVSNAVGETEFVVASADGEVVYSSEPSSDPSPSR